MSALINTVFASLFVGILAFAIARSCGLPAWGAVPPDASDIGMLSAVATFYTISALKDTRP